MLNRKTIKLSMATIIVSATLLLVPLASAYGPAQWQAAFSGNFTDPITHARAGFWGWCDFADSAPDLQSGNEADCQLSSYFFGGGSGANTGNLFHADIQGNSWSVHPTIMPGPQFNDFFITSGSATVTGPLIVTVLKAGAPVPPGCTVSGDTGTCPLSFWESIHLIANDTGIPATAGHFSLANIAEAGGIEVPPGTHIDIQVVQIPQ